MAFSKRRRQQPPTNALNLHNILALVGLGSTNDADAEAVTLVRDRIQLDTVLLDGAGVGQNASAWVPVGDHGLLRIAVEYHTHVDGGSTREFVVALRTHDNQVVYAGVFEPDNPGLSIVGDVTVLGAFKGVSRNGLDYISVEGIKDYKLILLAKAGGVTVSAFGGVG